MPPDDWNFLRLADLVLREYTESGAFSGPVADHIFATENQHTGRLAGQLDGYERSPRQALARLAPLAARFPANPDVQTLQAAILEKLGDYDGAIAALDRTRTTGEEESTETFLSGCACWARRGAVRNGTPS